MAVHDWKLNERAARVANELAERAAELNCAVHSVGGGRVIDAGVQAPGGLRAGVLVARVCLADLGEVALVPSVIAAEGLAATELPGVQVTTDQAVAACMASQYAGWQVSVDKYFAMGSGPMRAAYGKEAIFTDIRGEASVAKEERQVVGVLETGVLPDEKVVRYIAEKCRVPVEGVTLIAARTASLAGGVQIAARSVETALHKLHTLKFDLARVRSGYGVAPLPPVAKNDLKAIGRTNDAVLYGASVTLMVTGDDESLAQVGVQLPASSSRDYGKPFVEIFESYQRDFYKIDPLLFSPAVVCLQNVQSGKVQRFGELNHAVLRRSFFG